MAVTLQTSARNAACDGIVDLTDAGVGAGTLEFKTSGGTSTAGNGEVATLTFSDPAFGAAATGVATASAITSDTSATGGTTTQAYIYDSDSNPVLSCSVGTSGEDINLSSVIIGAGDTVAVTALTVTVPAS